jgi:methionyl-tRNA synthetase
MTQHFFTKLNEKGFIFKKTVEQPFCEKCKKFLPDRYVIGTCPYCQAEDQYSDGCEKCGKTFQPGEILNPHCIVCGSTPITKESEHYFFKLSEFSDKLKNWLNVNKNLQSEVKNYVLNWIEEGLKDWDITRDISWGVPIPLEEAKGKVLYGWFDNHLCYISAALKYLSQQEKNGKEFWNSSKIYHFIGKDIVYHHYLFLPAMRMGVGEYKVPDFIPTRGHLLFEGQKFSKSRGWYVSLRDFLKHFNPDYLRYYVSIITPYQQSDVNFDWSDFQSRINNELIANIGNFIHRTLTFIHSKFKGKVPNPDEDYNDEDAAFQEKIWKLEDEVGKLIEDLYFDRALKKILEFSNYCNQYFQKNEPWSNEKRATNCVYLCVNAVRSLAILLEPFLPFSTEKLWKLLNYSDSVHEQKWDSISKILIKPGYKIKEPKILFKKIEDKEIKLRKSKIKRDAK